MCIHVYIYIYWHIYLNINIVRKKRFSLRSNVSRFQNSIWTPLPLASTFIQVLLRSKPWHWCWVSGITGPRVKEWSKDFMTNIAGDEWRKVFWNATLHTQSVLQVTFIGLSGAKNWRRKTSGAVIEILAFRLVLMVITLHSFTWHMQLFRITYMSLMHILAEFFFFFLIYYDRRKTEWQIFEFR